MGSIISSLQKWFKKPLTAPNVTAIPVNPGQFVVNADKLNRDNFQAVSRYHAAGEAEMFLVGDIMFARAKTPRVVDLFVQRMGNCLLPVESPIVSRARK